jgi:glycosyltransferase involved in cell wall biosynthesis
VQRIVVDARAATVKSGIGNYTAALLRHMVPLAEDMTFLLLRRRGDKEPFLQHPRVEELAVPGEPKSIHTFWIGRARRFEGFDLYHGPSDIIPWGIRCPWVTTIHDMTWLENPHLHAELLPVRAVLGAWYRIEFGHAIRGAERVITVSRASADAIARVFPEAAQKVRVTHLAVDRARYAPERAGPREAIARIVPAGSRYSLIVGRGEPYKNHAAMIRAFVEATRADPDHKLVVVRRFARLDFAMQRLLNQPDVKAKIIHVPFVSDAELLALYRHAVALLFASHVEGFGLPALEAMAMDLPVLISTDPALQEVAAGAALSAVSTDHDDLVAKIRMLSTDDDLRARLTLAGRERVAAFSWEKTARATLDVYREAIESAKRRR